MLQCELAAPKIRGQGAAIVKRADGSIERNDDNNMLLDSLFTYLLLTGTHSFNIAPVAKVGTGTSPSEPTMTQLEAKLSPVSGNWPAGSLLENPVGSLINSGASIYAYEKWRFVFPVGSIVGNISEYGIDVQNRNAGSNAQIDTRVLIKDVDGNPTTLTLGVLDQLIIEYTFSATISAADRVSTIVADENGVSTNYELTIRMGPLAKFRNYLSVKGIDAATNAVPVMTDKPMGAAFAAIPAGTITNSVNGTSATVTIDGNAKKYQIQYAPNQGNQAAGMSAITVGATDSWFKLGFNPPLPKTANNSIILDLSMVLTRA